MNSKIRNVNISKNNLFYRERQFYLTHFILKTTDLYILYMILKKSNRTKKFFSKTFNPENTFEI